MNKELERIQTTVLPMPITHVVRVFTAFKGRLGQLMDRAVKATWDQDDGLWHWEDWSEGTPIWRKGSLEELVAEAWFPVNRLPHCRWWIVTQLLNPGDLATRGPATE